MDACGANAEWAGRVGNAIKSHLTRIPDCQGQTSSSNYGVGVQFSLGGGGGGGGRGMDIEDVYTG